MGTLPKNVHIMWESHSSRSYNALSASLSATFRVYRTISCASGLFNVVIQAEHNCVPPSDRRLRTSSLLTKKARHTEVRPGSPRGRNLSLSSSSFSFTLPFLLAGWKKRKVQRIMAVLSLCKRGMGTPAKCLAFCDNEEKSKSLFRCGICTGKVRGHLKRGGWSLVDEGWGVGGRCRESRKHMPDSIIIIKP